MEKRPAQVLMMKNLIVFAKQSSVVTGLGGRHSGVALIQVLLISAMVSVIAIRFTYSARDQIQMAEEFDRRIRAELVAHSVSIEVIFLLLSKSTPIEFARDNELVRPLPKRSELNLFGSSTQLSDGVSIVLQDLDALLPQMFPKQALWRRVLSRLPMQESDIDRYLGTWSDFQDADYVSWQGDVEPIVLPSGQEYLNAFAQNGEALKWVFSDNKELVARLSAISDINASSETNLFNAPALLLKSILDDAVAEEIIQLRSSGSLGVYELTRLLPRESDFESQYRYDAGRFNLEVHVEVDGVNWRDLKTIYLRPTSTVPYDVIVAR